MRFSLWQVGSTSIGTAVLDVRITSGHLHDCDIFTVARNSGVERKGLPTRSIFAFVARCKNEKMNYFCFSYIHIQNV